METLAPVFSYEFYKISKNTLYTEHLRTTASVNCYTLQLTQLNLEGWLIGKNCLRIKKVVKPWKIELKEARIICCE